eukprot:838440-Pyramimonas_sp.AAC.1
MPEYQFDGQSAIDGFTAVVAHFSGYSVVIITFYGFTSVGLADDNIARFAKLGSFLSALQLPWIVVGDFNVSSTSLAASGFLARVGDEV